MSRIDARLRELRFLARLDQNGPIETMGPYNDPSEQQMIASMLHDGYLNDGFMTLRGLGTEMLTRLHRVIGDNISKVMTGEKLVLSISHKGRVRLSELEQQLKTGRDRDDTGLMLARRHFMTDLTISILEANDDSELSVAFIDMNDLRAINNECGHAAGDEAILVFLQAVKATFGQFGEAYRNNGGDEVLVILPKVNAELAGSLLSGFVRYLGKDILMLGEAKTPTMLTASCGSVSTTNPNEDPKALRDRADKIQYRAKEGTGERDPETKHWKRTVPRVSAYAVGDTGEVTVYDPRQATDQSAPE